MLLTLSIISAQGAALGSGAYRVFDAQGGTIGRVDANDWVLPDAAKFVSSHHARIRCHNNIFYLQDLSTNGTFLNAADTPVSKSDLTALADGDRILIGDYEILVQLIDDGSGSAPEVPKAAPLPAAASNSPPRVPDAVSGTADPLILLGEGAPAGVVAPPPPASVAEPMARAPPPPAAPQAPGGIPDDWQLTGFNMQPQARPAAAANHSGGVVIPAASPVVPPAPPLASTLPPAAARVPPAAAPALAPDERITALFKGLGVDPERVSPETFAELGEILRIVVQGMIEVLQSRTEVKNNFRVPMTTMRPVENNPLKFSLNVDDAIHNLFVKRNPGYLQPVDAFREGFRDVAFHQLAMLAGIRTAFNSLLERFEPDGLEEIYERKLKRTMLLGMATRLKFWDMYCEQFEEYGSDAEATFQNLFGEAFAKAYFDQLQQLATTSRLRKR
jgi:type VI secretion system FHA domain protein